MSILIFNRHAVTLLTDGTVRYWGSVPSEDLIPGPIDTGPGVVEKIKVTDDRYAFYALTECGHTIEIFHDDKSYRDITDMINKALGHEPETKLVDTRHSMLVIAAGPTVLRIHTQGPIGVIVSQRTFESEIDMISNSFIRTCDNVLYPLGSDVHSLPIDFDHTENIRKIVCETNHTLILLKNGSVYARGYYYSGPDRKPFSLVTFPEDESVLDIISRNRYVFYIMASGRVYHSRLPSNSFHYGQKSRSGLNPEWAYFLMGYFVENIFMLHNCIMFQHDGGKLCVASISYRSDGTSIDEEYYTGTKPTNLAFFNDKPVAHVMQYREYIYFTTESGQVYYCLNSQNMEESQIKEILFFRNNPIKIESKVCKIGSAGSHTRKF